MKILIFIWQSLWLNVYSLKLGFNFKEIFLVVAMLKSVILLLSILVYINYEK